MWKGTVIFRRIHHFVFPGKKVILIASKLRPEKKTDKIGFI